MTEIKVSELPEVTTLDDVDLLMGIHLADGINGSKKITIANVRSLMIGAPVAHAASHAAGGSDPITITPAQAGADPAGTASAAIVTHEAAANPHPQYITEQIDPATIEIDMGQVRGLLGSINSKQNYDQTLDALAAMPVNLGFVAQIVATNGTDKFQKRTITGTSGQVTVSNGNGVLGNPTLSLPSTITLAITFQNTTGIDVIPASTRDGLRLSGIAHGTLNRRLILAPARLSGTWTQTFQDRSGVSALTSDVPAVTPVTGPLVTPSARSSFGTYPSGSIAVPALNPAAVFAAFAHGA